MKQLLYVISLAVLLCFSFGFQSQTTMNVQEAIRKADGDWLKAVQSKDIIKVLAFLQG